MAIPTKARPAFPNPTSTPKTAAPVEVVAVELVVRLEVAGCEVVARGVVVAPAAGVVTRRVVVGTGTSVPSPVPSDSVASGGAAVPPQVAAPASSVPQVSPVAKVKGLVTSMIDTWRIHTAAEIKAFAGNEGGVCASSNFAYSKNN